MGQSKPELSLPAGPHRRLGLIMRLLVGAGTPRELLAVSSAQLLVHTNPNGAIIVILAVAADTEAEMLVVSVEPTSPD